MSTIVLWFKKTWLVIVITALCFASAPLAIVYAVEPSDPISPPVPTKKMPVRLEGVWAREQVIYSKLGVFLNNIDQRMTKGVELINKAKANGKDTLALQTALDTFSAAVKQAEPIYQSTNGIVSAHQGFDENGKVTDQIQAISTVKDLGEKFKEIRQLLLEPRKALREALKVFRQANTPTVTPAPTQSGG